MPAPATLQRLAARLRPARRAVQDPATQRAERDEGERTFSDLLGSVGHNLVFARRDGRRLS
jgi:hypothetical protein